jgi:transcriptional regulator with XRE-family HTH domain
MDMKIDSKLVVKYRNEKAWSQQQLADICDLSLRTIQRAENTANASQETVKALASAFDIDVATILLLNVGPVIRPRHIPAFVKASVISSTFFALIASLLISTPLTSAKEIEFRSNEVQTSIDTTEFRGDVKIIIPANKKTEISAIERMDLGDKSIYKGEVVISIDEMKIRLDAGVVYKTKDGWAVTTDYAKLSHNDDII